jgi:uncharacterized membrane protein YgcG
MKTSGIILELNKKQALIMTDEAGFMGINRKPGMFIGEQVDIEQSIHKKFSLNRYAYSLGLASIAIVAFILLLVIAYSGQKAKLYAYVSVDINPSMEFAVNKEIQIINAKGLNNAGKILLRSIDFQNMPVDRALMMVVEKAQQNHYFHNKNGKYVLIAAAVKTESLKRPVLLAKSIQRVEEKLKKQDIHLQFIQTTLAQRTTALQNNLSTGRYILSNTAVKSGQLVDLKQAKADQISALLEKAGFIKEPKKERKAETVTAHEKYHHHATGSKAKNKAANNAIGADFKTNDTKDEPVYQNNISTSNDQKTENDTGLNASDSQMDDNKDDSALQGIDSTVNGEKEQADDWDIDVPDLEGKDNNSDSTDANSGKGNNKGNSNSNNSSSKSSNSSSSKSSNSKSSNSSSSSSGGSGSSGHSSSGKK